MKGALFRRQSQQYLKRLSSKRGSSTSIRNLTWLSMASKHTQSLQSSSKITSKKFKKSTNRSTKILTICWRLRWWSYKCNSCNRWSHRICLLSIWTAMNRSSYRPMTRLVRNISKMEVLIRATKASKQWLESRFCHYQTRAIRVWCRCSARRKAIYRTNNIAWCRRHSSSRRLTSITPWAVQKWTHCRQINNSISANKKKI